MKYTYHKVSVISLFVNVLDIIKYKLIFKDSICVRTCKIISYCITTNSINAIADRYTDIQKCIKVSVLNIQYVQNNNLYAIINKKSIFKKIIH